MCTLMLNKISRHVNQTAHLSFRSWFQMRHQSNVITCHISSQWLHMAQLLDWSELHDTVQPCTLRKDVKERTVVHQLQSWVFVDIRLTTSHAAPPEPIGHLKACLNKNLTRPITAIKFAKVGWVYLTYTTYTYVCLIFRDFLLACTLNTVTQEDVKYRNLEISHDTCLYNIN